MANYVDEHSNKVQMTPGGTLCQVFGSNEGATCSVALVEMDENNKGVKHEHDNITEIYVFAEGKGKIIINEHENEVNGGECYIINPGNVHYIESIDKMKFLCICTPPWEVEHEFVVNDISNGNNILRNDNYGVLQVLGNDTNHNVSRLKINNEFVPDNGVEEFRRVYYFVSGEGNIIIDGSLFEIKPGDCYEVNNSSLEKIIPNGEVDFVYIYDKF